MSGVSGGGLPHVRSAPDSPRRGEQHPGPRPLHQGRLVPGPGRVPQGGDLAHPQDAALAEESRTCGVQVVRGQGGPGRARLQAGSGGVVVVAVGHSHRVQQLLRAFRPRFRGQDGGDL